MKGGLTHKKTKKASPHGGYTHGVGKGGYPMPRKPVPSPMESESMGGLTSYAPSPMESEAMGGQSYPTPSPMESEAMGGETHGRVFPTLMHGTHDDYGMDYGMGMDKKRRKSSKKKPYEKGYKHGRAATSMKGGY